MKKVVVASTNPIKLQTAKTGFELVFPGETFIFECVKAVSGVADQPLSETETLRGAHNRITHAQELTPGADFYIGLEGGMEDKEGELHEFAWIVVKSKEGKVGKGKTGTFFPPVAFRKLILEEGKEMGEATDIVFGDSNSKQKMGAIGHLTKGAIDRTELYRHAVIFALMPFLHEELY
ncbi:MAG TPA: inosine/xanthosine triphosphatase [Candidatus Paceibacterota bacterium]